MASEVGFLWPSGALLYRPLVAGRQTMSPQCTTSLDCNSSRTETMWAWEHCLKHTKKRVVATSQPGFGSSSSVSQNDTLEIWDMTLSSLRSWSHYITVFVPVSSSAKWADYNVCLESS